MTKKISIELEEVKVVGITIDLGNDIQNYQSKFLALKNHERETERILEVKNFYGSNQVDVTILIDDDEDEAEIVKKAKDFVGQFGIFVGEPEVDTAFLLDKQDNDINSKLGWKEMFIYN